MAIAGYGNILITMSLKGDCKLGELLRNPAYDGFRMPAEFEQHHGCIMIWPERPGSWAYEAREARKAFCSIAEAIVESEQVYMLVSERQYENALQMLSDKIRLVIMDSDDAWARDTGPTFVVSGDADISYKDRILRGINWKFNAWGGEYDGLYADWSRDDKIAIEFMKHFGCDYYNAAPFVLEGGSIHTDGEGTLLVTENCLLSKGRNPGLSKSQIEEKLKMYCNVHKIIWLPCGIYNDETNEHVDNVCAFTSPGEVVLAWTDDKNDPSSYTCLAGDITGDYEFDSEVNAGDRLVFEDMAIYSMVKNNTFNGIPLPDIAIMDANGDCRVWKHFDYDEFKRRL